MAPQRKRKSESASIAEEAESPAAKRVAAPDTPATGEKRKRGRPRKYPEGSTPKRPDGPKRGRGRPRKDPNAPTPSKSTTPKQGKRGRPRKTPVENGTEPTSSTTKTETVDTTPFEGRSYWLMKAEPDSRLEKGVDVKFSIDDLAARKEPEPWDGVRNPVAQKHIRDMKKGDLAFFYHSNCKVPGIAGIMEIVKEHSPDESAFDPAHPYYDEKSNRDDPKWQVVHVEFRRKFNKMITLNDLKSYAQSVRALENMQVLKQSRLSVTPVSVTEWAFIMGLAEENEAKANTEASKDDSAEGEEPESSE
ncbi:hypothetical protein ABZX51_010522 [Aspergillus tubingensis]|uniref:Thymocyte nuclear protein 1 n=1 Tax=Aspergillus tubingensis (strain CBS 134.48) TaxID=767770 RepID=A0A1L9MW81_ASPTC|nr:hypothetical protein ASPTUDRAFT_58575 [Aspergillus tubingensis CBS 134.48]